MIPIFIVGFYPHELNLKTIKSIKMPKKKKILNVQRKKVLLYAKHRKSIITRVTTIFLAKTSSLRMLKEFDAISLFNIFF